MTTWAILHFPSKVVERPIVVNKPSFSIGRSSKADLTITSNRLLSGVHCKVEWKAGTPLLTDSSTNGTVVNGSRVKDASCVLRDQDTVHLIQKGSGADLAFTITLVPQQNPEDALPTMDLNETPVTDEDGGEEDNRKTTRMKCLPGAKRKAGERAAPADDGEKQAKLKRVMVVPDGLSGDETQIIADDEPLDLEAVVEDYTAIREGRLPSNVRESESTPPDDSDSKTVAEESKIVSAHKVTPADVVDKADVGEVKTGRSSKEAFSETKPKHPEKPPVEQDDDMLENLQCCICCEIIHDCVSVQPCLHCFCAGCYSDWMKKSNICPQCRGKVHRICKNHIVNNIIESYLKLNADRKRDEDELKELDAKNKITADMAYPKRKKRRPTYDQESEDSRSGSSTGENSDEDDDDDHPPLVPLVHFGMAPPANPFMNNHNQFHPNAFGQNQRLFQPYVPVCRQCFGYTGPHQVNRPPGPPVANADETGAKDPGPSTSTAAAGPSSADPADGPDGPSTSTAGVNTLDPRPAPLQQPTQDDSVCPQGGNHILCTCCMEPMPHRTDLIDGRPTKCSNCQNTFCHLYWTCLKPGCRGCLGEFRGFFPPARPPAL